MARTPFLVGRIYWEALSPVELDGILSAEQISPTPDDYVLVDYHDFRDNSTIIGLVLPECEICSRPRPVDFDGVCSACWNTLLAEPVPDFPSTQ